MSFLFSYSPLLSFPLLTSSLFLLLLLLLGYLFFSCFVQILIPFLFFSRLHHFSFFSFSVSPYLLLLPSAPCFPSPFSSSSTPLLFVILLFFQRAGSSWSCLGSPPLALLPAPTAPSGGLEDPVIAGLVPPLLPRIRVSLLNAFASSLASLVWCWRGDRGQRGVFGSLRLAARWACPG